MDEQQRFEVNLPESVVPGVYADFVSVWHTEGAFTLDFAAMVNPGQSLVDEETGESFSAVQAQVVSRVRIPPSQVFEIMKALEQQLSMWEQETRGGGGAQE